MTRRSHLMVMISAAMFLACAKQSPDKKASTASDTNASQAAATPNESTASDMAVTGQAGYPYHTDWIPGQRDTEDFDVLSKFRAHANRISTDVLILTLDTPANHLQRKKATPPYSVADSTVVTGLFPNELFTNYCKVGSVSVADGLIGGIPNTTIWDQWQRPRLAWRFDTVNVNIRPVLSDSVSCILIQPDN